MHLRLTLLAGVFLVGCASRPAPLSRVTSPGGLDFQSASGSPPSDREIAQAQIRSQVEKAIETGRFAEAEALVDSAQGEHGYGSFIPLHKAELLAHRGVKAEALALYLEVLRDPKMYWNPNSRELAPAFELAMDLGRTADADALATRMITHPSNLFHGAGVRTPREARSANARLAYAYLLIGSDGWQGRRWVADPNHFVTYALKAQALLPNSLPVMTQLAYAYAHRNEPGDHKAAVNLIQKAKAAATDPATRLEIENVSNVSHLSPTTIVSQAPGVSERPSPQDGAGPNRSQP